VTVGEPAVPKLIPLLSSEDEEAAISASVALNRIGIPAVPALIGALSDDNDRSVKYACSALWWISGAKAAVPALLNLASANDRSDLVRLSAASAAAKISPESGRSAEMQSVIPVLLRVLQNEHHIDRISAAGTLRDMGPAALSALPSLEALANKPLPPLSAAAAAVPPRPLPVELRHEKQLYHEAEDLNRAVREAINAIRKNAD
jgi:HEAT repeat protein